MSWTFTDASGDKWRVAIDATAASLMKGYLSFDPATAYAVARPPRTVLAELLSNRSYFALALWCCVVRQAKERGVSFGDFTGRLKDSTWGAAIATFILAVGDCVEAASRTRAAPATQPAAADVAPVATAIRRMGREVKEAIKEAGAGLEVATTALAVAVAQQAERPKRRVEIAHSDGTRSTVSEQ